MPSTQYQKQTVIMSLLISRDSFIYVLLQSIDISKLKLKNQAALSSQFYSRNDDYACEEHTFL